MFVAAGSGKSYWILRFLRMQDQQTPYYRIILWYTFEQPLYAEYRQAFGQRLLLTQNLTPAALREQHEEAGEQPILLIIDDKQWKIGGDQLANILCGASNHYNMSVILIGQSYFTRQPPSWCQAIRSVKLALCTRVLPLS